MTVDPTRREFFAAAGGPLAAAWITANLPGIRHAAAHAARALGEGRLGFEILAPDDAADLAALAEQVFPSDPGSPGAREAGVIQFIDRALGTFAANLADPIRAMLADLNRLTAERHPGAGRFAALDPARQEALMPAVAALPGFAPVRYLVVAGMFADPSYGGNRDRLGWKLLGFEDRFAWQPPFGDYDRDAHGAEEAR
jgi:gluconate 2-dehydrogenase gamma chain